VIPIVGGRTDLVVANSEVLGRINWNSSLAATPGRRVRIAVLDTGLSQAQSYLWSKVDASYNLVELGQPAFDQTNNTDSNGNGVADEGVGHGTMVAGVLDVVAPEARLVIVRVADSDGLSNSWRLLRGLVLAAQSGAEVANVSLATLETVPGLSDVVDWCEEKNMVVVGAIGNNGENAAGMPGGLKNAICVGGLNLDATKTSFSNWATTCDVSAPAFSIHSQWWDGRLATWSGTSFAAPLVSATIADSLRRTTAVGPKAIRKALRKSVANINALNYDYRNQLGGLLDVAAFDRELRN